MKNLSHCPYRQSTLLQQALAPDKMWIALLLGAVCPMPIHDQRSTAKKKPRTKSEGASTLAEKLAAQEDQRELESLLDRKRRELFARQDEIQARRDVFIEESELQLERRVTDDTAFYRM